MGSRVAVLGLALLTVAKCKWVPHGALHHWGHSPAQRVPTEPFLPGKSQTLIVPTHTYRTPTSSVCAQLAANSPVLSLQPHWPSEWVQYSATTTGPLHSLCPVCNALPETATHSSPTEASYSPSAPSSPSLDRPPQQLLIVPHWSGAPEACALCAGQGAS